MSHDYHMTITWLSHAHHMTMTHCPIPSLQVLLWLWIRCPQMWLLTHWQQSSHLPSCRPLSHLHKWEWNLWRTSRRAKFPNRPTLENWRILPFYVINLTWSHPLNSKAGILHESSGLLGISVEQVWSGMYVRIQFILANSIGDYTHNSYCVACTSNNSANIYPKHTSVQWFGIYSCPCQFINSLINQNSTVLFSPPFNWCFANHCFCIIIAGI